MIVSVSQKYISYLFHQHRKTNEAQCFCNLAEFFLIALEFISLYFESTVVNYVMFPWWQSDDLTVRGVLSFFFC